MYYIYDVYWRIDRERLDKQRGIERQTEEKGENGGRREERGEIFREIEQSNNCYKTNSMYEMAISAKARHKQWKQVTSHYNNDYDDRGGYRNYHHHLH